MMGIVKKFKLIFSFIVGMILLPLFSVGQTDTSYYDISAFIKMDSIVVSATRGGFDVDDFITMVQEDSTFYNAFRNLRFNNYSSTNSIKFYDKKGAQAASYYSDTQQKMDGNCRTMTYKNKQVKGNYYKKNKDYRYYTSKLYDRLFFTYGKKCETDDRKKIQPKTKRYQGEIPSGKRLDKAGIVTYQNRSIQLKLRSAPDTSSQDNILEVLPFGAVVHLICAPDQTSGWYFLETASGNVGYSYQPHFWTDLPEANPKLYKVKPGDNLSNIVKTQLGEYPFDQRTLIQIIAKMNKSIQIENSKKGWKKATVNTNDLIYLPSLPYATAMKTKSIGSNKSNNSGKHIQELKKLIFSPGQRVDVPFIGGRTGIFEEEMVPYYNYLIESKNFKEDIECYVFKVEAKPPFLEPKNGKTIIKSLETYFDKSTFQVIARNYTLSFYGLFDFDVTMNIELDKIGDQYIPSFIKYDGFFKVPTQKREQAIFQSSFQF